MADSCERDNEPPDFIKGRRIFDQLSECQFLK
jgi:hypothetical protein